MTKFASLKKIHTKIIIVKRYLELNDLGFFYYSAKSMPWLAQVYIGSFFNLYITLPWYSFSKVVATFIGILAPHFETGKTKRSDRAHEACCNVLPSPVSWWRMAGNSALCCWKAILMFYVSTTGFVSRRSGLFWHSDVRPNNWKQWRRRTAVEENKHYWL